ncbi:MAG: FKBP-type peptidyl-prolyl cis-trans isomerase [Bacteroidales bacterium]|nr:FKBP-type peptidyl-prolyl cis-trans isomerase [Bacteroidales bacterium]
MRVRIGTILKVSLILILISGLTSCFKENLNEENEREIINNYLKEKGIDTEPTESGLYYVELIKGTGIQAFQGDTVEIFYIGYYLSGQIFAYNMNTDPYRFAIGSGAVIPGLDEGVSYMREGGEALLVVPSSLAYGAEGNYQLGISGYTPLAFEVILDKVIPGL